MSSRVNGVYAWLAAVVLAGTQAWTFAQPYPVRVVRFIIPSAPGGGSDLIGRTLAQKLGPMLGQQVVSDNRPGAGGRIGAEVVARAAPDGYTLLIATSSVMIMAPALYAKLPYDMSRDFTPVSLLASAAYVLVAHPSVPARSIRELIALAHAHPGKLTYASSGSGSSSHLAGELFAGMAHLNLVHVPYRASALSTLSVMAGETDTGFSNMLPALSPIRTGRLRPMGITSIKRSALLPDVVTIAESGLAGFEVAQFYGMLAPAGTPREIVRRLNETSVKAMQAEDVRGKLLADGSEVGTSSPEQFDKLITAEIAKWTEVIRKAGVKPVP